MASGPIDVVVDTSARTSKSADSPKKGIYSDDRSEGLRMHTGYDSIVHSALSEGSTRSKKPKKRASAQRRGSLMQGNAQEIEDNSSEWLAFKSVALMIVLAAVMIGCMTPPRIAMAGWSVVKSDLQSRAAAVVHLSVIPPMFVCICLVVSSVALSTKKVQVSWQKRCASILFALLLVGCVQARKACAAVVVPEYAGVVDETLKFFLAFVTVTGFFTMIRAMQNAVRSAATAHEEALRQSKPVLRWRGIMENFSRHRNADKDDAYSFDRADGPAEVLCDVVDIYAAFGKACGAGFFMLVFLGVDTTSSGMMAIVLVVVSAGLVSLHIAPALQNLIPLSLSHPFYLGEIISLSTPGAIPRTLNEHLTGFVEAITLTHVVLRDFKRKQVWVTHAEFSRYIVHNWTRRPCRLIHIQLTVSPTDEMAPRAAKLADFGKQWMDTNDVIDPTSYKKAVICKAKNGLLIEYIMYPLPGKDSYPIRAEFIVALTKAAKRLQVPLVPSELFTPYPSFAREELGVKDEDVLPELGDLMEF